MAFYLCAVGRVSVPALMFCRPALINDWFDQRVGTFMGLCSFTTALVALSLTPLGSAGISIDLKVQRCYLILRWLCLGFRHPFCSARNPRPWPYPLTFSSTDEKKW